MSRSAAGIAGGSRRPRWRWLVWVAAVFALALGAFAGWGLIVPAPMPEALAALGSTEAVAVSADPWLTYAPANGAPRAGLVFYPGARIDPRAYAPAMAALAAQGYLVVTPRMPLNLAVLAPGRAQEIIAAHADLPWAIGGHSLGGAMAAQFATTGAVRGLVLWGAYPPAGVDLRGAQLRVAVVYGSADGLSTPAEVEAARLRLPAEATWTLIVGGNHAGYGWYGAQRGDGAATISSEAQEAQAVAATAALLASITE